jgi:uncharacterized protein YukE
MSGSAKPVDLFGMQWPEGDPGALKLAAHACTTARDLFGDEASKLGAQSHLRSGWRGDAAGRFHDTVETELEVMKRPAGALGEAAAALRSLAGELKEAQRLIGNLAEECRQAQDAAHQAASRAATPFMLGAPSPLLSAAGGPQTLPGPSGTTTGPPELVAASKHARDHAEAVITEARRRAHILCHGVHSEDVRAARAVEHAATLAPMGGRRFALSGSSSPAREFGADVFKHLDKAQMQQLAYHLAHITKWDPDKGLIENGGTVHDRWGWTTDEILKQLNTLTADPVRMQHILALKDRADEQSEFFLPSGG